MNKYAGSSKEYNFIIVIFGQINKTYFENEEKGAWTNMLGRQKNLYLLSLVDQINKTYFENEVVQEIKICQLKKHP
jgi:hypothetical protein